MFVVADHSLISAVPFLVPALIIVGYLVFHVVRDRRNPEQNLGVGGAGWDDEPVPAWDDEEPVAATTEKAAGLPDDPRSE